MSRPFDVSRFRKNITKSIAGLSSGFNDPTEWISTGNYCLNYLISGNFNKGIPLGRVTVFAGESGCLPESAKVNIRLKPRIAYKFNKYLNTIERGEITIKELKVLYNEVYSLNRYDIEINTPDGFQKIGKWFNKGVLNLIMIQTPSFKTVCAVNHLIQIENNEWMMASELDVGIKINTKIGIETIIFIKNAKADKCYDFEILHENHSYYGDGIVSHNSGKSFIAAGNIASNAQKQGIYLIIIDSEQALGKSWLQALDVNTDENAMLRLSMNMIDDVAKTISEFIKEYKLMDKDTRPKVLFIVDSLGMLLTSTDISQFESGDMKGDLGRKSKALTALVRNCVNMFGDLDIGMVATNHTYASQDMFNPDDKISGGCLTNIHNIVMADRSVRNISDITVGDVVMTLEGDKYVEKVFKFDNKEVFELELENGDILQATGEHRFLVENGANNYIWKLVTELNENDQIIKYNF